MRGAVEWSYELLTEEEKRLFRELAVFAGGFTLQATESICDCRSIEGIEVLDLITSLVDKSLLVSKVRTNRESRFRMLGVIREYADEASEANGDAEEMRNRHAAYFLVLAEAEPHLDNAKAVGHPAGRGTRQPASRIEVVISRGPGKSSPVGGRVNKFLDSSRPFDPGARMVGRSIEARQ